MPALDRRRRRRPTTAAVRGARAPGCEAHQNADGGWGEDLRSYAIRAGSAAASRPPSQTAWALLALLAARRARAGGRPRRRAGSSETQRPDGTWDEPWFTGTGFPGDFYINYHLYRLVFPVIALGRYSTEAST